MFDHQLAGGGFVNPLADSNSRLPYHSRITLVLARLIVSLLVHGSNATVVTDEVAAEHTPLVTRARNCVVFVRMPVLRGLVVEAMSTQIVPLVEDCHLTIPPVWPLRLMVVLVPRQICGALAVAVPPTDTKSTVTSATNEFVAEQTPLVTTARNWVLFVKLPVFRGLAVEAMSTQVVPLVEDCHPAIAPV